MRSAITLTRITSDMQRLTTLLLLSMLFTFVATPLHAGDPVDQHHVMWTTEKGARKCITKKTREKAERAAELLRRIASFSEIEVAQGKCAKK